MRRHRLALALLLAFSVPPIGAQPAHGRSYELRGGSWFTGTAFERRHVYVADSSFAARRPVVIDSVIDLRDQYLVPPFADAHTHLLTYPASVDSEAARLLHDGVFYVLSLTGSASGRRAAASHVNNPSSVDVAYADALTSTRGHPILSAEVTANHILWDSVQHYWPTLLKSTKQRATSTSRSTVRRSSSGSGRGCGPIGPIS
jgi:imidazolonepropionase-like amidohydrolase